MSWWIGILTQVTLAAVGLFMILVVLLQRGRGGGLAGALGGAGGQSAFGTKAGDVFTKITIGVAVVWVLLAGFGSIIMKKAAPSRAGDLGERVELEEPAADDLTTPGLTIPDAPIPAAPAVPDLEMSGGDVTVEGADEIAAPPNAVPEDSADTPPILPGADGASEENSDGEPDEGAEAGSTGAGGDDE